jgi:hypothetical protein
METMDFSQPILLGRTGLKVGRLGVAAGYGAPTKAFEEAFDKGCNYFYFGSCRNSPYGMAQLATLASAGSLFESSTKSSGPVRDL